MTNFLAYVQISRGELVDIKDAARLSMNTHATRGLEVAMSQKTIVKEIKQTKKHFLGIIPYTIKEKVFATPEDIKEKCEEIGPASSYSFDSMFSRDRCLSYCAKGDRLYKGFWEGRDDRPVYTYNTYETIYEKARDMLKTNSEVFYVEGDFLKGKL